MKKFLFSIMALAAILSFGACSDTETYADMRDKELDSISAFLRNENIKVISEETFQQRWKSGVTLTDTSKNNNEYVLFNSNGIYMQVIDQGCGDYIAQGETAEVLIRFDEHNISALARLSNSNLTLSNRDYTYSYLVDKMTVTNTSGTFTGVFDTSSSLMVQKYNVSSSGYSSTVPSGWLIPFTWIKVGRPKTEQERMAHIRLLVPHSYGTTTASGNVNAYLYEMYIQRGK